ncbi:MAG: hypothetical protein EZS28_026360 [Streblomastix strix]|uniref:Uncharacterized protein n=1 Tax=Streblomastix strix TaxID=222440 RepID=A0A5J4V6M1_9EUKA|nr:MAG: hypothetical protein EZS28_026360 [Streblomastix strix]
MTQASGQSAHALFTHFRDGADLNMTPSQPLADDRDANGSDTNVFASDREITVTDADAGPALKTSPMQEIQFFIMRFMELLTGRNAFAIEFWANSFAQAQNRDYMARILHETEVIRHTKQPPHQILNNTVNCRVDGFIQNLQFLILILHKLTILSKQHMLEGVKKDTLIDQVSMWAALLRFAERCHVTRISTIQCFVTDTGTRISGLNQPANGQILINSDGTRTINYTAGDVCTNSGYVTILLGRTGIQAIDIISIPWVWHVPRNTTILRFSVKKLFLTGPTFIKEQHIVIQIAEHHLRLTVVHVELTDIWSTINTTIQFINSTSSKLRRPSSLLIKLPELES